MSASIAAPTTSAIQAWRVLGKSPGPRWVEWAVQLLLDGLDTPHVRIVAGLTEPFDYFETIALVDRALAEVGAPALGRREAVEALMDFYLLHDACLDLREQGDQHYWAGAHEQNIDMIVRSEARRSLIAHAMGA